MHELHDLHEVSDVHARGDWYARWSVTARATSAVGGARGMECLEEWR